MIVLILSAGFLFCRFPKHNEFKPIFLIALFLSLLIGLNSRLTNRKISWINRNASPDTILIAEKRDELIPLISGHEAYLSCYTFLKSTPINRGLLRDRRNRIRNLEGQERITEILIKISRDAGRSVNFIRYSSNLRPKSPLLLLHTEKKIEFWGIEK